MLLLFLVKEILYYSICRIFNSHFIYIFQLMVFESTKRLHFVLAILSLLLEEESRDKIERFIDK